MDAVNLNLSFASLKTLAQAYLLPFGIKLVISILVFFVGRWLARLVVRGLARLMDRSRIDVSLSKFLSDVLYAVLLVAVVTAALDTLGIRTTAVVAVLGAAGLAIGLALQGSLSNFAAGVMLIVLRPYRVGDQVIIGKHVGRVDAIKVFHTFLVCEDNREVIIPNGQIIAAPIENMTTRGTRRIDLVVSVASAADVAQVRQLLEAVLLSDPRVLPSPPPAIDLVEVGDAGTKLMLRPWSAADDYRELVPSLVERTRDALAAQHLKFTIQLPAA
ncbi:MAG: mechanosensitive ion channel [Myxococcales bacterium]|nr:mechanosensitive ion channel [Myxococcales bacterium]HRC54273.1 mechanosensitive ion channel [Kofleriaceae bacterium]